VGNEVHYLIPLTNNGARQTYCFTFLTEAGKWYFEHLESITIRLDKIGPLPTSTFPDVPEAQKFWMREEILVSEQVRLFNMLAKDKGREFAFERTARATLWQHAPGCRSCPYPALSFFIFAGSRLTCAAAASRSRNWTTTRP